MQLSKFTVIKTAINVQVKDLPILDADGKADALDVGHATRRRAALCVCHLQSVERGASGAQWMDNETLENSHSQKHTEWKTLEESLEFLLYSKHTHSWRWSHIRLCLHCTGKSRRRNQYSTRCQRLLTAAGSSWLSHRPSYSAGTFSDSADSLHVAIRSWKKPSTSSTGRNHQFQVKPRSSVFWPRSSAIYINTYPYPWLLSTNLVHQNYLLTQNYEYKLTCTCTCILYVLTYCLRGNLIYRIHVQLLNDILAINHKL